MNDILNTETLAIPQQLTLMNSPTSNSLSAASPAKLSQLLDSVADLTIPEALSFLTSHGLLKRSDHSVFYLKTSKDCYLTTVDELLKPYCPPLMSWVMMRKQWCLTARISRQAKDHASLSTLHTGTTKLMLGKGPSKPHRYTLASARGHELQLIPYKKLAEVPPELYEHLQSFPIGWTDGKPSTVRKRLMGNAAQPNVIRELVAPNKIKDSKEE